MFSHVSYNKNFHLRRIETVTPTIRISYHIIKIFKRDKIITKTIIYCENECNILNKSWYDTNGEKHRNFGPAEIDTINTITTEIWANHGKITKHFGMLCRVVSLDVFHSSNRQMIFDDMDI
jgi:hypothetical protein